MSTNTVARRTHSEQVADLLATRPTNEDEVSHLKSAQQSWLKSARAITEPLPMLDHLSKGRALVDSPDEIGADVERLEAQTKALKAAMRAHSAFIVTMVREGVRAGVAQKDIAQAVGLSAQDVGRKVRGIALYEQGRTAKVEGLTLGKALALTSNATKRQADALTAEVVKSGRLPEPEVERKAGTRKAGAERGPSIASVADVRNAVDAALDLAKRASVTSDDKDAVRSLLAQVQRLNGYVEQWGRATVK